ncbi:MAG: glycosyltransferase family 4 protein [Deltaproteobacteria bacterium]|nr:glycosyltransferase family 4 protein [Deltaproteobacteria bacterium]
MRVIYWTQLFWPYIGGEEVLATKFIPAMRELGYDFMVVTSHGSLELPDEETYKGIPIRRFPFQSALENRSFVDMRTALHRLAILKTSFGPALIHINFTDPSVFFHWQTIRAHPCPTLVSTRVAMSAETATPDSLLGRTLTSADWVTTISNAMLHDLHRLAPEIKERASLIYNALETPQASPRPLCFENPTLLCLGRVVDDKGFDIAVKALPRIIEKAPKVRLIIAGDGPARPDLMNMSNALGLSDAVKFTGWVNPAGVPDLINTADVVIVPSRCREAFGLVALQAAQMGRPVIATRVGGLPEVVLDNETGVLIAGEDHAALSNAVLELLHNPAKANRLGECGRFRARRIFSWESYLGKYDKLYQQIIRKGGYDDNR